MLWTLLPAQLRTSAMLTAFLSLRAPALFTMGLTRGVKSFRSLCKPRSWGVSGILALPITTLNLSAPTVLRLYTLRYFLQSDPGVERVLRLREDRTSPTGLSLCTDTAGLNKQDHTPTLVFSSAPYKKRFNLLQTFYYSTFSLRTH